MTYPSKTYEEYVELGKSKGLIFLQDEAPTSVRISVSWKCEYCGRVHNISSIGLRTLKHGCRCRHPLTSKESDYHEVALGRGIQWIDDKVPLNVRTPTKWLASDGKTEFVGTYYDVKRGRLELRGFFAS